MGEETPPNQGIQLKPLSETFDNVRYKRLDNAFDKAVGAIEYSHKPDTLDITVGYPNLLHEEIPFCNSVKLLQLAETE